ncbi:uncharacterized protein [Palaemon carinicauda]|uniref:uncharacterized protein n=1 Tax=Palaemon carinicauda TaxID=392227 RepID=UPI0035B65072
MADDDSDMDCKGIPNESVLAQHKLVMADFNLKSTGKRKVPTRNRRIKTWKPKGEKAREFRSKVERTREEKYVNSTSESPEEMWEVCSRPSGKHQYEKETWWWNHKAQTTVKEKGIARRRWAEDNYQTSEEYRWIKRETKRIAVNAKEEARRE